MPWCNELAHFCISEKQQYLSILLLPLLYISIFLSLLFLVSCFFLFSLLPSALALSLSVTLSLPWRFTGSRRPNFVKQKERRRVDIRLSKTLTLIFFFCLTQFGTMPLSQIKHPKLTWAERVANLPRPPPRLCLQCPQTIDLILGWHHADERC